MRYAQSIIDDVADGLPQQAVIITYATAILAAARGLEQIDWRPVNRTIIDRWSLGALDRIKRAAWKLAKQPPGEPREPEAQPPQSEPQQDQQGE